GVTFGMATKTARPAAQGRRVATSARATARRTQYGIGSVEEPVKAVIWWNQAPQSQTTGTVTRTQASATRIGRRISRIASAGENLANAATTAQRPSPRSASATAAA